MRFLAAVVALLMLTACDADKWKVTSNPSGDAPHPDGGLVIVVVKSTLPPRENPVPGSTEENLEAERDPVQVYVLTDVDDAEFEVGDGVIRGRSLLPLEIAR